MQKPHPESKQESVLRTKQCLIELEPETIESREDAMVKKMLDGGPFAFVVLGGGHDLSDNIERLGSGTCEYLTLETGWYSRLSRLAGAE